MTAPLALRTERLLLRPWQASDAPALHPILEANWDHLGPWIPARVSTPAPIAELAQRLAGFAHDFATSREWRYAVFDPESSRIVGEMGLYPRSAAGRAHYGDSDRVEVGYWLRSDVTGRGYATEAARAVIGIAVRLPRFRLIEIRCDARNVPSAALPRRLGFTLSETVSDPGDGEGGETATQVWTYRNVISG